jgi:hypothetical protein
MHDNGNCCRQLSGNAYSVHLLRVAKASLAALLRHYSGHAQERHPKWFRQIDGALQLSGVLQKRMSTLREESDGEQFRAP